MKFQNELVLELESLKRELAQRLGKEGSKKKKLVATKAEVGYEMEKISPMQL